MTKVIKATMLILTSVLVMLVLITGIALLASAKDTKNRLDQLSLRKEDQLAQQQKLSMMIDNLNSSLQQEISKNFELASELVQVTNDQNAAQQAAAATQQSAPPTPAQTQVVSRVVTRAS